MKLLVTLSAVLSLTTALPQKRLSLNPQQQADLAEQNYQQQDYRKPIEDFRPKVTLETTTYIPIIRFDKEQGTDGSYKTGYETGNHIVAEEQGYLKAFDGKQNALVQQGYFTYTAPDGQVINAEYTADELGFRVKGDHLPTPPPVSPEIQKGLDLIYAGIEANRKRHEEELKANPSLAKQQEDNAALDYQGFYHQ